MTETDTSRNKLHRLIGQLSHDYACDLEREASDVIVALLARAEKAEAERDEANEGLTAAYLAGAHAAKRDAWNDAIEAAAQQAHKDAGRFDTPDRIRTLRKGEPA